MSCKTSVQSTRKLCTKINAKENIGFVQLAVLVTCGGVYLKTCVDLWPEAYVWTKFGDVKDRLHDYGLKLSKTYRTSF